MSTENTDPIGANDGEKRHKLTGMFTDWFLDYASYVILERAVPHIDDGLKPVQRRILHAMKDMDDEHYNKVANIIGHTMQYHPHGDASIGDALVQLGQKELLIDCQGNWGNLHTGDGAAAPRYIEARLTELARDILYNPKTTAWMPTYDGRNTEPVTLPVRFPLLLAQGVEGIAVGLASKILPHNFNELIDAAIAHLRGKDFELLPDLPTGGMLDPSRYNDGLRGGAVKIRAHITKLDRRTLLITDIPYGKTTTTLIESILKANDKGKIKIRKVDDNTAQNVEIVVHLHGDASPDKTIDALYAFTDCETSISPNACVINDNRPQFISVKDILRHNADHTRRLLQQELQIRLGELRGEWHRASLERIFFEHKIYRQLERDADTWEAQLDAVAAALAPYAPVLHSPVTDDDVAWLVEKPVRKISKFDLQAADERIRRMEAEQAEVENNLVNLTDFTVEYFRQLKKKYGRRFARKTELRNFETIEATQVAVANARLYVNRAEGFVGMDLKRDEQAEYVSDCSDIDELIIFLRNGKYLITKVQDKAFVGKDILHLAVFRRNDERTIYNLAYRHGKHGAVYVKRFAVTGITRDREYDATQGAEHSQILWLTANPAGEAETLRIRLQPRPKLKKTIFDFDFSSLAIRGRNSMGNILSRYPVHKITLKERGAPTLGGLRIWFDPSVQRLNTDGRGTPLGEFRTGERLLAITRRGTFYTTDFDLSNRYEEPLLRLEKLDPARVCAAVYFDAALRSTYLKRFTFEPSDNAPQPFISDAPGSRLLAFSADPRPQLEITFAGRHAARPAERIDVENFIGQKSFRAKGKRITTYEVATARFLDPVPTDGTLFS